MTRGSPERAPRALLVVLAVVGFARGPWREGWSLRALAVVAVGAWCGWRTLRRVDDAGLPLGARLGATLAGLAALAAAFVVADVATGAVAWPSLHALLRPRLLADAAHLAALSAAATLLLPGRLLAAETRDPAAALLGWAAATAVGLFGALTPLRHMSDAWWPPGDPRTLLLSLAFGAGWAAAASRWRAGPVPAQVLDLDEHRVHAASVALLVLALLLAFFADPTRSGAGPLGVLLVGVHLLVLWRRQLPRGLRTELAATALLATGFGAAVAWTVPRPALRWARRDLGGLDLLVVPDRVALGASVALAALVLLLLLRRRTIARP